MHIPDLSTKTYSAHDGLRAVSVGWLGKSVPRRGVVPPEVMQLLRHHREHSYFEDNLLGSHTCEICGRGEFHGEFLIEAGELTFVLPVGIFHYIEQHGYCPPDDFMRAILPAHNALEPTAAKSNREPWHRRYGREQLLRPRLWLFVAFLYGATFVQVALLMFVLGWVVPHLPWISKPYVSPDPPPLVTAFRCANFVLGFIGVLLPILFIFGPTRQVRVSWPKKNETTPKT